jgi:hypothetical protein
MFDDFEKFLADHSPGPIPRKTPAILFRKGGDRLDWSSPGSQVFVPVSVIVQIGALEWSGAPASSGSVVQALQARYEGEPLIFVQVMGVAPADAAIITLASSGGDAVEIAWKADSAVTLLQFAWIAYGGQLRAG